MDKRIKKGSAVLTAWTLIAVLGASPAGAAFLSYASVMERSDQVLHATSSSEERRVPATAAAIPVIIRNTVSFNPISSPA